MDFTVDRVGSYLVRLVVDAGLPTESTQYVRLRALTASLGLKLVAAGERRDATGVIPVDVDTEGWANEQNFNLLTLEAAVAAGTAPLADVLVVGNTTGGTDILMTTGDKIIGQTDVEIDSTGAGTNIVLNPDAAGSVVVNGKLTVTGLIDPTGVIFDEAGTPTVAPNKGGLFVSDGTGGLEQNEPYYKNDAGNDRRILHVPAGDPAYLIPYNLNMPDVPNDTVQYQGWVPTACVLQAVRAMMVTLNTQGNYTLAVTNVASGNTCLSTATFDMNGLVAGGVTDVALTGTPADLAFSAPGGATAGRWNVSLVSDDAAFDGSDIYIELVFGVY